MEQYKLINAELMDQVQKQRILIGEMFKTEVILKKQLLEERELRLVDAQYNENKIKCAVRTLLQSLDIDLDSITDHRTNTRTSQLSSDATKESIYNREKACSELRRSSVLLRRTYASSPSRKSRSPSMPSVNTCNNSLVEQEEDEEGEEEEEEKDTILPTENEVRMEKTPEPRRLVDLLATMNTPDTPEAEVHVAVSSPDDLMCPIIEEYMSEEDNLSSAISLDNTDSEERSMRVSSLALRDLTNRTTLHSSSPKACSIPLIGENEVENCSQETRCSSNITTKRGKSARVPINNQEQQSIEHVRCAPSFMDLCATLTPRSSQVSFSSFNGISDRPDDSSTPQRVKEAVDTKKKPSPRTKLKPKSTQSTAGRSLNNEEEQSSSNSSVLSRPSRSCRPKSLKEMSCKTKLRNDSQSK